MVESSIFIEQLPEGFGVQTIALSSVPVFGHNTEHREKCTFLEDWWVVPDDLAQDRCTLVKVIGVVEIECFAISSDVVEVWVMDVVVVSYISHL
jgi:hypothetical protein